MIDIPVIDMCKTGQNIVHYRKQQGLSVKDLQNILKFANPNAIYKWQKGKSIPTVDNLIILSALFKVPYRRYNRNSEKNIDKIRTVCV